jgi:amicyanin
MKQNKIIAIVVIIIAVVAVGGAALLSGNKKNDQASPASSSSSASANSTAVAATKVDIQNYMFSPMSIKVKVGDTVTWTNKDSVHHNVVADTASSDAPNGPLIGLGETYSFKFTKAGTYTFHCNPHPYMHGSVTVTQ